ncbi:MULTISPECIES: serine hydrolase [Streptomyces]|uniref:Beta-lactamase class A catalytic domain-containing protein n=2 Tax=Streptomyces TaxID=1883 RepID=A0A2U9NXN9_STRAS|nr:serine hydrolase [Streptomyces actuosus]AWT42089.1 hypothetical protein DMT42_07050 [Streptomyces actuosus]MBM4825290.1 serine hydrolase [Streptomyces actuosus]
MESPGARRRVFASLSCLAVLAAGTAVGAAYATDPPRSGIRAVAGAREEASVEPVVRPATVDRQALLEKAVAAVAVPEGARVSVAVLDLASGERAGYRDGLSFDTASIVKVDILAALLLRAQDTGRSLSAAERAYATAMIERSDNASASALWRAVGRAPGLRAANERLGLAATVGGDGMLWGLTRTTAADQLTLLSQVFGEDSALSAASRAYVRGLMGRIAEGQRWGVSAAADGSTAWALKNGWLPRSTTGLWDVNSVGRVTAGGREYVVAVLSDGNGTQAAGVSLVETVAKAAVGVFGGAEAS